MAQAIFDALAAGVTQIDNQAALAVQSLLDSQNGAEATQQVDEDDLFQCGKCKKQFTSLQTFISHKQAHCNQITLTALRPANQQPAPGSNPNSAFTTAIPQQNVQMYTAVPPSPLTQSMVLSEDIMAFTNIDPNNLQTLHMTYNTSQGGTVQASPFLSQVGQLTPRGSNNNSVTIYSPVTSTTFSANGSAITSNVSSNPIHLTPQQQQVTISPIDKPPPSHPKTSPTKAGRKSAQTMNNVIVVTDIDPDSVQKPKKSKNLSDGEDELKKKLRCQYCNKMFAKNFDLQQHVRSHTGEKPFQCIVCGRAFAQKSNVKKHMATHKVWPSGTGSTLPKPTKVLLVQDSESGISQCNSTMAVEMDRQEPEHEPQPIRELNIGSSTDDQGQVSVIVDNSYLCQYCPEKFKTYFLLKSHMVIHKSEQVYKCVRKSCGFTFKDLDSFLEHVKTHEEDMIYRCHMCNKTFPSLYELGVHQYSHSLYPSQTQKAGPRHYQCTKCLNKYSTPEALDHHHATASHDFPCPTCKKSFTCERYLRRHLPTHGAIGHFQCLVCLKRFKTESYLKMHSLIHSGDKPFVCDRCGAAFNRKDKLKRHVLIHQLVKKFKCPFKHLTGCTLEFNRPDKLKAHIIAHSGIKPFRCRECGKSFSRRPHCQEHERGHRADFRFTCQKCGKGFFRPKLFQEHKCNPMTDKDGVLIVPPSRVRHRRKIGRPRKRMITVTPETVKNGANNSSAPRPRGRPRRSTIAAAANLRSRSTTEEPPDTEDENLEERPPETFVRIQSTIAGESQESSTTTAVVVRESGQPENLEQQGTAQILQANQMEGETLQVSFRTVEYEQVPGAEPGTYMVKIPRVVACDTVGDNLVECGGTTSRVVTLQADTTEAAAAPIYAEMATASNTTYAIVDNQPMEVSVQTSIIRPVAGTQVVVARATDGSEETFAPIEDAQIAPIEHYVPETDPVLQGTESLMRASEEILRSAEGQ